MRYLFIMLVFICANSFANGERVIQVDPILGKQPHKQQYVIVEENGKTLMCPANYAGIREFHKPCLAIIKEK